MVDKTIIRDDTTHSMMITLHIKSDEVLTEKFKEYAEELFIVMLAKHVVKSGWTDPEKHFAAYMTKMLEVVAKAASVLAEETGKHLTSDDNRENTLKRVMRLLAGKEVKK